MALSRYEFAATCYVLAVNCPMKCLDKFVENQNQLNQISLESQRSFINPDATAANSSTCTAEEVLRTSKLSNELREFWEEHAVSHTASATGGGKELYRCVDKRFFFWTAYDLVLKDA